MLLRSVFAQVALFNQQDAMTSKLKDLYQQIQLIFETAKVPLSIRAGSSGSATCTTTSETKLTISGRLSSTDSSESNGCDSSDNVDSGQDSPITGKGLKKRSTTRRTANAGGVKRSKN